MAALARTVRLANCYISPSSISSSSIASFLFAYSPLFHASVVAVKTRKKILSTLSRPVLNAIARVPSSRVGFNCLFPALHFHQARDPGLPGPRYFIAKRLQLCLQSRVCWVPEVDDCFPNCRRGQQPVVGSLQKVSA